MPNPVDHPLWPAFVRWADRNVLLWFEFPPHVREAWWDGFVGGHAAAGWVEPGRREPAAVEGYDQWPDENGG